MRRYLKVPQISAVMGQCIAGGAYLPALSDVIIMVEKTSFMGLGGPNLVKGATGQTVDSESLGGAWTHNALSGVAHYRAENDEECIEKIRELIGLLPPKPAIRLPISEPRSPSHPPDEIYDLIPSDHRQAYDMFQILARLFDGSDLTEFQADYAREMICGYARIEGIPVGFLANQRKLIKDTKGGPPRLGGIIYSESAEKAAYFIETCNREGTPILFIQDVSGFMVGPDAEQSGIIRAGAQMVEAMATATVPRIVLTINHASGAGYYSMAGQGFDPDFIFTWPTGRMGVMEGDSAIQAVLGPQLEKAKGTGQMSDELKAAVERMRAEYEQTLDARFAASRGFVDAIIAPEETRQALAFALRVTLNNPGPHIGPFHITTLD
jgi:acetyl-CoA carboxylase carboxyltransferase component